MAFRSRIRTGKGRSISVSPAPPGVPPSQVSNLTPGTATTSTIPLTYTAATGTATITYQGFTSPHGANSWTVNGGTFTSSGGTFIGLSGSTNYDLKIVATNAYGTSTSTYLVGVSTATPTTATTFTINTSASSGSAGVPVTLTVTPGSGGWPANEIVTPSATGLVGSWDNTTLTGSGTTPLSFTFTPSSGPGTNGTLTATATSPVSMTNTTGSKSYSINSIAATGAANRYDLAMSASGGDTTTSRTLTIYPNGTWNGSGSQTITLTPSNGSFTGGNTVTIPSSGNTPVTKTFTPSSYGAISITATNNGGLYDPYPHPYTCLASGSGNAQTIAASLRFWDQAPHQRDTANGNPTGFSFSWAKGWGEVWFDISAISGTTSGLWIKLYDALSAGASTTLGSGTVLNSTPVQVYGTVTGTGRIRVLLPAGPYWYFAEIATDSNFTNPIRIANRFGVGNVVIIANRSGEGCLVNHYPYGPTDSQGNPILYGVSYYKAVDWHGTDYRYPNDTGGWFRHDGVSTDPDTGRFGNQSSSGIMELGRLFEIQTGCITGVTGAAVNGMPFDEFIDHTGAVVGPPCVGTVAFSINNKARYFWLNTVGWSGSDPNYPNENYAEYHTRLLANPDWISRNFPAVSVIGWCLGNQQYANNNTGSGSEGWGRLQAIVATELAPTMPTVVSLEAYNNNETVDGAHPTMGARILWVQSHFRQFMAAEVAAFNGFQTQNRGPKMATTGTIASGSRVIRLPYKHHGGTSLSAVLVTNSASGGWPNDPTFSYGTPTATNMLSLCTVYTYGGHAAGITVGAAGKAIKTSSVAINTTSPPAGYDGTVDVTLYGASGITYSDNTTDVMPSQFTVQFNCDWGVSGGDIALNNGGKSVVLTDERTDSTLGIGMGWHMGEQLDIAISTV